VKLHPFISSNMSAGSVPAAPPNSPPVPRHRYRNRRVAHQNAPPAGTSLSTSSVPLADSDASLVLRSAPVAPSNHQAAPPVSETSSVSGNGPRGRGGRGGKGGRRGGSGTQIMSGRGRVFGGRLTRSEGPSSGSLQGDAPEFRPGQPVQPRQ
jgi:transcriptional repressor NF-X1